MIYYSFDEKGSRVKLSSVSENEGNVSRHCSVASWAVAVLMCLVLGILGTLW